MIIHWNASPEIFSFGPIHLRWYGLMFLAGFSLSYYMMQKICGWENKPTEKLDSMLTYGFFGTLIGARLGHCLFYDFNYYFSNPLEILKVWEGGLASHGGGTGVILALYLFSRKNKEFPFTWLFDRCAVFVVMTGSLIRLGNLMNSEILGRPTDGTWGVIFDKADSLPRHPAMVYESLCYLIIFGITWSLYLRKKSQTPTGLLAGIVISAIMICRFVIEFFKEPQSGFEKDMIINMGQILSLPFIAAGFFMIYEALTRPKDLPAVHSKNKNSRDKKN